MIIYTRPPVKGPVEAQPTPPSGRSPKPSIIGYDKDITDEEALCFESWASVFTWRSCWPFHYRVVAPSVDWGMQLLIASRDSRFTSRRFAFHSFLVIQQLLANIINVRAQGMTSNYGYVTLLCAPTALLHVFDPVLQAESQIAHNPAVRVNGCSHLWITGEILWITH